MQIYQAGKNMAESPTTTLKLLEGFKFKAEFDHNLPSIIVDELAPLGKNEGPNPSRLLSVAIGHCLSSSLLFCLQKAHIKVQDLQTTIKADVQRNSDGFLRIESVDVSVKLDVAEEDKPRLPRCLSLFENYCTVTQSIRQGIKVNVDVQEP